MCTRVERRKIIVDPLVLYRFARALRRSGFGVLASGVDALVYLIFNCVVPSHAVIGPGTTLEHRGLAVVINRRARVGARCKIGPQVVIGGRGKGAEGVPVIGDDVYIGVGAKLLGGITIGDGALIGANAVVLDDVPAGRTAVGVPARVI